MSKNIVLCSDGTGNANVKDRGTNVFKLYEAVDVQGHKSNSGFTRQIAVYDDGVGTSDNAAMRLAGQAFGLGFSANVRKLYRELVHVYELGDRIFLFGFSRGAYTVRTLAGFVGFCGVLDRDRFPANADLERQIKVCWEAFERQAFGRREFSTGRLSGAQQRGARQTNRSSTPVERNYGSLDHESHAPNGVVPIECIGVWDTVAAVGAPFKELAHLLPYWFNDLSLGSHVRRAYHALSIDDQRLTFEPELWQNDDERIEQVWFAGVHSNVGGGYPKQGMSLEALDWMMSKVEAHGLRFIGDARDYVSSERDVHSTLYDSRANWGVLYRWQPRDISKICSVHGIARPNVHISVFERIAQGTEGYAPGNIPFNCQVVSQHAWPGANVLEAIQKQMTAYQAANAGLASLINTGAIQTAIRNGQRSYKLFLCAMIFAAPPLLWFFGNTIAAIILQAVVGVASYYWAKTVTEKLDTHYSGFWSNILPPNLRSRRGDLRNMGI